ncbi:MAG: hypothetical protein ABL964_15740 [Steroidobacteraceae bacterium]
MCPTFTRKGVLQSILVFAVISVAAACQSAEPRNAASSAEREQMAAIHDRVARCLRSDQPVDACREEMRKGCESMKGGGCGMMDMSRMHGAMGNKDAKGTDKDTQHQH